MIGSLLYVRVSGYDFLLTKTVNEIRDKNLNERLKYYCREFLAEIERVGIEICRHWIRNNIAPIEMEIEGKKTTKYDHDWPPTSTSR